MTVTTGVGRRSRRLEGVDAARGLALFGMMAVHILPGQSDDGSVSFPYVIASGRSSALFAVLAGLGIALGSGGGRPLSGAALAAARRALAARAAVITAIGLTLGTLGATVAVILAYYGVLFLTALPVLGWRARRLAMLAGGSVLVAPLLSQILRSGSDRGPGSNVSWADLAHPVDLAGSILLFGYYPVLTWTAYLFAGLAVGRCALGRPSTAARTTLTGAALTVMGLGAARVTTWLAGGHEVLADRLGTDPDRLSVTLTTTMYGTTPTDSWWWLGLAGRHSGSAPDLLNTGGSALLVLGCCLLVLPRLGRLRVLAAPVVAAGAMPLTLYTLHTLALAGTGSGGDPGEVPSVVVLVAHVVGAAWIAALAGVPERRGPLEMLAAVAAERARGTPTDPAAEPGPEPPAAGGDGPPSAGRPPG